MKAPFAVRDSPLASMPQVIKTIEMHTAGEPLRVIVEGGPDLGDHPILEQRRRMKQSHDGVRRLLMHEPRGHADMYGCLPVRASHPDADFGVLFMHNAGYSTMCGHAVIALARLAVEQEWVPISEPRTDVTIEAPCGLIRAWAEVKSGRVGKTGFLGVPASVQQLNAPVDVDGLGRVLYDLAYGGAFYAFVDAAALGFELFAAETGRLIDIGMRIKRAVAAATPPVHPAEPDLSFLYGTIFVGPPVDENADSRNVCVFADGEVDRSPTGSGVSARMAIHHAHGELSPGETMRIESILGTTFDASIEEVLDGGAVVPRVEGRAFVTGRAEFTLDPDDPIGEGFLLK